MAVRLKAPCKINLYLRIGPRRADGYHDVWTLFYPVGEPCDELVIEDGDEGLEFSCSDPALSGGGNLVARAYAAFGEATGFAPGLRVYLEKRTPHGMGLGGGSSDAAAMLRYLNERAGDTALGAGELVALAAGLGADVPFFLDARPAWGEGIGERLTPVDCDLGDLSLVLVCPEISVSTAWAYQALDEASALGKAEPNPLTSAYSGSTRTDSGARLVIANDFESVVFREFPELRRIKEDLVRCGAAASALSGSGAGVFALFRKPGRARQAADALRGRGLRVFLSGPA